MTELGRYLLTLPDGTFAAWLIIALAGGGAGMFLFLRGILSARTIGDVATSRVRSAPQGYVELIGTGRNLPGPPIVSPLSGVHCLWYSYQIDERQSFGDASDRRWKMVERGTSDGLFSLEDDTGTCIVDPHGARVVPHIKRRWYGDSRHATAGKWAIGGRYRFRELRLEKDWPLYAIGNFSTLGTLLPDESADAAALLRELKRDPERMKAFDRNADGNVDEHEWEVARYWAKREARRQAIEEAPPEVQNLLSRGESGRSYILSGRSEKELIRQYRWEAILGLLLLMAGTPAAVWMLILRFVT